MFPDEPCPWCGDRSLTIHSDRPGTKQLGCLRCGVRGPAGNRAPAEAEEREPPPSGQMSEGERAYALAVLDEMRHRSGGARYDLLDRLRAEVADGTFRYCRACHRGFPKVFHE